MGHYPPDKGHPLKCRRIVTLLSNLSQIFPNISVTALGFPAVLNSINLYCPDSFHGTNPRFINSLN